MSLTGPNYSLNHSSPIRCLNVKTITNKEICFNIFWYTYPIQAAIHCKVILLPLGH